MKQLSDLIKEWEMRHGVTLDTMKRAKAGESIKRGSKYMIARALGCSDAEAKEYADQADSSPAPETAKRRTAS